MSQARTIFSRLVELSVLGLCCAQAIAESYTGSYVTEQNEQHLTLQQSPDGNVTGTLQQGSTVFQVNLGPLEDKMVGAAQDPNGIYYPVLAQLYQGTLYFKIYQADEQRNAIDSTGVQLDFQRRGGVAPESSVESRNPTNAGDWTGRYENHNGVGLALRSSSNGYRGALTVDGTDYPLDVQASSKALEGTFTSDGKRFPLRITIGEEANQLLIESEGTLIELSRVASNPLASKRN